MNIFKSILNSLKIKHIQNQIFGNNVNTTYEIVP